MNQNYKDLQICVAVVQNAKNLAVSSYDVWILEMEKTDRAIALFGEDELSIGYAKAAIGYRDYLWRMKATIDILQGIDMTYLLEKDYYFALPDEKD